MHCKNCDYALWNLKARQCPECGLSFQVDQYEFVVNAVRFCCPHCDQNYYGTSEKGHLVPSEFTCVTCGQFTFMNETVLRPADGVQEQHTRSLSMPWLDHLLRQESSSGGYLSAWLRTIGKSLITPTSLMDATPPNSSVKHAFWFAAITHSAYVTACFAPWVLLVLLINISRPTGAAAVGFQSQHDLLNFAKAAAIVIGMAIGGSVVWALVTHAMLRLMRTPLRFGIKRTFQAIFYSSGANALMCIPCIGFYVSWIWWIISAVLMVFRAHQVHLARAAIATLTFPVLVAGGFVALIAISIYLDL